jgi:hypothetical protein
MNAPIRPAIPSVADEPFLIMLDRLREILLNRARYKREALIQYMLLITGKKLFIAHDSHTLEALWDSIRKDDEMSGFVVELTREFHLRCRDLVTEGQFSVWLASRLEESLGVFISDDSTIDSDTLEQFQIDKLYEALLGNPWFMVMQLAVMCRVEEAIDAIYPAVT